MPSYSDREIVEKANAGDIRAFRLLVERHQAFVYSLSYRFVGTVGDAEDIAQESFIRLWKNLSLYRTEVKLTTWLYKIVTNLCLDFLKSRYNKNRKRMVDLEDRAGMISEWNADQPILDEELLVAVEKITADLSPKQKAVFVLRDLEDLPMQEIAKILSMSPGKVKSNLYYARKKVGEKITVYYETKKPAKQ
jgi:RNA polymerase sigma-70 factor, ECF subfamily